MSGKVPNFGLDEEMKKKMKLDGSASGAVANQEALKPSLGKRKRNQEMVETQKIISTNLKMAEISTLYQQRLADYKPKKLKNQEWYKRNWHRAADQDRLNAQIGERSSSKDQTPTQSRRTPLYTKTLTYDDVLTGKLTIPPKYAGVLLPKRPERKHDRIMVPFKDNRGVDWKMEATHQGLSLNWDKFVKEHGLQPNDGIFFYNDDPSSDYYNIEYEKNGDAFVS